MSAKTSEQPEVPQRKVKFSISVAGITRWYKARKIKKRLAAIKKYESVVFDYKQED